MAESFAQTNYSLWICRVSSAVIAHCVRLLPGRPGIVLLPEPAQARLRDALSCAEITGDMDNVLEFP